LIVKYLLIWKHGLILRIAIILTKTGGTAMSRNVVSDVKVMILIVLMLLLTVQWLYADESLLLFSDPENGFNIRVPADWKRQDMNNNESSTYMFVSPDQNVSVAVTSYKDRDNRNLEQVLNMFQQSVFAGSEKLLSEEEMLNGIKGWM
jgi:hypothetical protein